MTQDIADHSHRETMFQIVRSLFRQQNKETDDRAEIDAQIGLRSGYAIRGKVVRMAHGDENAAAYLSVKAQTLVPNPNAPMNPQLAKQGIATHYVEYDDIEYIALPPVVEDERKVIS